MTATGMETGDALSILVVNLLKGVVYREDDPRLWSSLLTMQTHVREYVAVMALTLVLDEAEGHAFLSSRPDTDESKVPRLIPRRALSFPVSILLALLRKKLAEVDAGGGGDTRLILTRDDIVDLVRVFAAGSPNEAKLRDSIEANIAKIVDLGFLRKLKSDTPTYEVRRILKAFVDARWLAEFNHLLAAYAAHLQGKTAHD